MKDDGSTHGFFRDDGLPINPELVPKPSLCILCLKDDDPAEEIPCLLNRADQQSSNDFICDAFVPKNPKV